MEDVAGRHNDIIVTNHIQTFPGSRTDLARGWFVWSEDRGFSHYSSLQARGDTGMGRTVGWSQVPLLVVRIDLHNCN